jgi:TonB family protein
VASVVRRICRRLLRTFLCGPLASSCLVASVEAQDVRDAIGPLEKQSRPASDENPIPRRAFAAAASYPPEGLRFGASGRADLMVTVDVTGRVAEIRKLTDPIPISASRTPGSPGALYAAGDAFIREAAAALRGWTFEPPAGGPVRFFVEFSFQPGTDVVATEYVSPPIRVGSVPGSSTVKRVEAIYPPAARQARVTGTVILEINVGVDGRVTNAKILRGIPLLDRAALDAVRQWEYRPTLLNGEFMTTIRVVSVTFP